jgi:predicted DNA-binding transcriptional regulator AlpA
MPRAASEARVLSLNENSSAVIPPSLDDKLLVILSDMAANIKRIAEMATDVRRIADALDAAPAEIVGTPYVAQKLGVTTTWIADLIRKNAIPATCIVQGTGNGKVWKFYRERIDEWIASR